MDLQTNGSISAISGETEALLFAFLNHLPLGSVTSFISVVIIALFFVTSADSGILSSIPLLPMANPDSLNGRVFSGAHL